MLMVDLNNVPEEDESSILLMLCKDEKPISQVSCPNSPVKIPEVLHIKDITPAAYYPLSHLPRVHFHAAGQNQLQRDEWEKFLTYIIRRDKVAVCQYGSYEFLITPPVGQDPSICDRISVAYRIMKPSREGEVVDTSGSAGNRIRGTVSARGDTTLKPQTQAFQTKQSQGVVKVEDRRPRVNPDNAYLRPQNSQTLRTRLKVNFDATCTASRDYQENSLHPEELRTRTAIVEDAFLRPQNSQSLCTRSMNGDVTIKVSRDQEDSLHHEKEQASHETMSFFPKASVNMKQHMQNTSSQNVREAPQSSPRDVKQARSGVDIVKPRYRVSPEYLNTLRHSHNEWPFGALAELIDNSRDANASRLDISIQMEYYKRAGNYVPVLSVIDNGCGMSHSDIVRMVSLGHARPTEDNKDHIGRFGVGFKTGSMQLGKDVVVLTQSNETRSIAFLSRSYNENKQEVDIPIITYRKVGGWMDFDLEVHSEEEANAQLQYIKDYSPFNEYSIGSKFARFGENGTGTQIYIYNLALWGSDYSLDWDEKCDKERNSKKKLDIRIRSRRVRSRQGQISQEVPLDYSLHAYLEVIFLNPRMKIYVQGTMVTTRPLARSLNNTKVVKDVLMGKHVELHLGRSQEERERGNCGIFLYWHGRLIEAYKRVGGMVQSADMGRGVIGVIDVTEIMKDGDEVMVLNTKQRFQDCEIYAVLEQWLGCKADEYWDENFDSLELRDNSKWYKPDHDWVQCNKCRKWRILDPKFNAESLPPEWFCFMAPFKGVCDIPEQKVEPGVITVSAKRSSGASTNARQFRPVKVEENVTSIDESAVTTNSTRGESEISTYSEDESEIEPPLRLKRIRRGPPRTQTGNPKRARVHC